MKLKLGFSFIVDKDTAVWSKIDFNASATFLRMFSKKGTGGKNTSSPQVLCKKQWIFLYIKFVNYTRCPCKKLKRFRAEGGLKILPSLVLGKAYLPVMDLLSALSHPSGRTKQLNAARTRLAEAFQRPSVVSQVEIIQETRGTWAWPSRGSFSWYKLVQNELQKHRTPFRTKERERIRHYTAEGERFFFSLLKN